MASCMSAQETVWLRCSRTLERNFGASRFPGRPRRAEAAAGQAEAVAADGAEPEAAMLPPLNKTARRPQPALAAAREAEGFPRAALPFGPAIRRRNRGSS